VKGRKHKEKEVLKMCVFMGNEVGIQSTMLPSEEL
jgi:hypothetical protein